MTKGWEERNNDGRYEREKRRKAKKVKRKKSREEEG